MLILGIIKDMIREPTESKIIIQAYFEQLYAKKQKKEREMNKFLEKQKHQNTRNR